MTAHTVPGIQEKSEAKPLKNVDRVTIPVFRELKHSSRKISVLTAYDFPSAKLADEAGMDAVLVGDSLANVVQGRTTTLPVTLEQMIYHAQMVRRAVKRALIVVDMPFPTCQLGPKTAIESAARVLQETEVDAVKIEGGKNRAETIRAVVEAGIPVFGHCGLLPQNIKMTGGYKIQRDGKQLLEDVLAVEQAGAFAVVLELIPDDLAKELTAATSIPTIGIGAGKHCDGQVLVFHDVLGFSDRPAPKHVKSYAKLYQIAVEALRQYRDDVETGKFPE